MHSMFTRCLKLWVTEQITPRQHSEYARKLRKSVEKQALGRQVAAKSVRKKTITCQVEPGGLKRASPKTQKRTIACQVEPGGFKKASKSALPLDFSEWSKTEVFQSQESEPFLQLQAPPKEPRRPRKGQLRVKRSPGASKGAEKT